MKNRLLLISILLAVSTVGGGACASGTAATLVEPDAGLSLGSDMRLAPAVSFDDDPIWPTLDERMGRYGISAVSMVLIENNQITLRQAYGRTSASAPDIVTVNHQFQAASISKAVAAVGVMTLVDSGQLDLEDPVNDHLTSWFLTESAFTEDDPVTIAELLSHTGGISVRSLPGFDRGAPLPSLDDILAGAENAYSSPVQSTAPQGQYLYSGGGYTILEKLVEDVSGQSFEAYMQAQVFEPLAMDRSTFTIQTDPELKAFGHAWNGDRRSDPWQDYPQAAAAGMWSVPTDLARLLIDFGQAYAGDRHSILSPETARQMSIRRAANMGLGFGVHGEGEGVHLSHAGWTIGYRANILYFPETGDGMVVMTNGDAGHHLIADLQRTLGARLGWPGFGAIIAEEAADWSAEQMQQAGGRYLIAPAGFILELEPTGPRFILTTPRGSRYHAVPIGPDSLILEETGDRVSVNVETGALQIWGMTGTKQAD